MTRSSAGYSLLELLTVVVLLVLLASAALPSFRMAVDQLRGRAMLDRIVAEIYRARMTAVENGTPVRLELETSPRGCVTAASLVQVTLEGEDRAHRLELVPGAVCVRHSGEPAVIFNSRGTLRPPTRSFHVSYGERNDSVLLSIAGRVRRTYRRAGPRNGSGARAEIPVHAGSAARGGEKISASGRVFRSRVGC